MDLWMLQKKKWHGRRKDFFQGGANNEFFQIWPKEFCEISLCQLKTKRTTFFY